MSQKKIRVGIVFGGRSGEHEVSLASAKSVKCHSGDQCLFFVVFQMAGNVLFFSNQFHWYRRIVRNELFLHHLATTAF